MLRLCWFAAASLTRGCGKGLWQMAGSWQVRRLALLVPVPPRLPLAPRPPSPQPLPAKASQQPPATSTLHLALHLPQATPHPVISTPRTALCCWILRLSWPFLGQGSEAGARRCCRLHPGCQTAPRPAR